jgi:hypothetical protein
MPEDSEYIVVPVWIPAVLQALGFHYEENQKVWVWGDFAEIVLKYDEPVDFRKPLSVIFSTYKMWGREEALANVRKAIGARREDEQI